MTKTYVEQLEERCQQLEDVAARAIGWTPVWIPDVTQPHIEWYEAPFMTLGYVLTIRENKRLLYIATIIAPTSDPQKFMGGVRCGSVREAKEYVEHTICKENALINRILKFGS